MKQRKAKAVVRSIPPGGPSVAPAEADTERRVLEISPQQGKLLADAQAAVNAAQGQLNLVAATILAGHGLEDARVVNMERGRRLTVEVPKRPLARRKAKG